MKRRSNNMRALKRSTVTSSATFSVVDDFETSCAKDCGTKTEQRLAITSPSIHRTFFTRLLAIQSVLKFKTILVARTENALRNCRCPGAYGAWRAVASREGGSDTPAERYFINPKLSLSPTALCSS